MATFTQDNCDTWRAAFESVANEAPLKGRYVRIIRGKYTGCAGVVTWHGPDTYSPPSRYLTATMMAMRQAMGREGYRIRVQSEGGDTFFCKAEYAEIVTNHD